MTNLTDSTPVLLKSVPRIGHFSRPAAKSRQELTFAGQVRRVALEQLVLRTKAMTNLTGTTAEICARLPEPPAPEVAPRDEGSQCLFCGRVFSNAGVRPET